MRLVAGKSKRKAAFIARVMAALLQQKQKLLPPGNKFWRDPVHVTVPVRRLMYNGDVIQVTYGTYVFVVECVGTPIDLDCILVHASRSVSVVDCRGDVCRNVKVTISQR